MTIRLMCDYTNAPQEVVRGILMCFNMLRPVNEVHVPMKEFCAALENFPLEWKRQSRIAIRAAYNLPQDPVDMLGPIN
jgi:hypothetical protein